MVRIRNAKPKNSSGGYTRVFNNQLIGDVVQKVHSTVITNGTELEKIISSGTNNIEDLDAF